MARVEDVAAYILEQRGPMTAMKLQKLVYYAYGYHLAWEERQLFPERFEAWANGPVCYDLYQRHRGRFTLNAGEIGGESARLDFGERESVDLVLRSLGGWSAHQLSTATHGELPWVRARDRAGARDLERSDENLRDEDIMEYFDALTAADGEQG